MTANPDSSATCGFVLFTETELAQLRKDLLRFAVLQLRNEAMAEDAVQDTLTSAILAQDRFEQRASARTWVFSILRNKIIDVMRDGWQKRRVEITSADTDESDFDALFKPNERWQPDEMPSHWRSPDQVAEDRQFWNVFEICMTQMPETTGRVFSMREFLGMEVKDICKELNISTSNCWVILHRARMILRLCLQQRWFGEKD